MIDILRRFDELKFTLVSMCQQSLSSMDRPFLFTLYFFCLTASCRGQQAEREDAAKQQPADPFILYGPHGYNTFVHARCQEVPTANVSLEEVVRQV